MSLINGKLLLSLINGGIIAVKAVATGFATLDSDGNSFDVPLETLNSNGNSFTVSTTVLDSDGNPFSPI